MSEQSEKHVDFVYGVQLWTHNGVQLINGIIQYSPRDAKIIDISEKVDKFRELVVIFKLFIPEYAHQIPQTINYYIGLPIASKQRCRVEDGIEGISTRTLKEMLAKRRTLVKKLRKIGITPEILEGKTIYEAIDLYAVGLEMPLEKLRKTFGKNIRT